MLRNSELLPPLSRGIFQLVLEGLKLNDRTVSMERIVGAEVGYTGFVVRARVHGARQHKFVLKCGPNDVDKRNFLPIGNMFEREIFYYERIFSEFRKLQDERDVSYLHPKFYGSSNEDGNEIIILEDMAGLGYVAYDQFGTMDYEHVTVSLKAFARLHAFGVALRDQKKEVFDELAKNAGQTFFTNLSEQMTRRIHRSFEEATNVLVGIVDEKIYNAFVNACAGYEDTVKRTFGNELESTYSVFTQIDCRLNNILFKYQANGVTVDKACLIDWQIGCLASPTLDVLYVILLNTTKELRNRHYEDLIRIYYASFADYLRRLGSDPDRLFTFEVLLHHLKHYGQHSMLLAAIALSVLSELSEGISNHTFNYHNRLIDLVTDCFNLGILRV